MLPELVNRIDLAGWNTTGLSTLAGDLDRAVRASLSQRIKYAVRSTVVT